MNVVTAAEFSGRFSPMAWAVPAHSLNQVDKAGKRISLPLAYKPDIQDMVSYNAAFETVNNWRASHQFPLNTFQVTLRNKARRICKDPIVSQRIKRLESIQRKLSQSTMQLSQMQDIGGCRVVLPDAKFIRELQQIYATSEFAHELKNTKDYISTPKTDGYRSVHLIYRYASESEVSRPYNRMQIEIQIRSQFQHAWATAVEAVSTFTKQALKWRGGDADWQRFFFLMSQAIATREGFLSTSGDDTNPRELALEIKHLSEKLNVRNSLKTYSITTSYVGSLKQSKAKLLLVQMSPDELNVKVEGFRLDESRTANDRYLEAEKAIPQNSSTQAVLVRVDSVSSLRKAYPNYFLDTDVFVRLLHDVVKTV